MQGRLQHETKQRRRRRRRQQESQPKTTIECVSVASVECFSLLDVHWPMSQAAHLHVYGRDLHAPCRPRVVKQNEKYENENETKNEPTGRATPVVRGPCFQMVLLGFTRFYWVLLGFTGFYPFFYWVLLIFTGFYCVLLGFTGFYWVFTGFFFWVLPRFEEKTGRTGTGVTTRSSNECGPVTNESQSARRRPRRDADVDQWRAPARPAHGQ